MANESLEKLEEDILKGSEGAIQQLINVLNKKLDLTEVDPEKMSTSLKAYRQAQEDALKMIENIRKTKDKDDLKQNPKEGETKSREVIGVEGRVKDI